VTELNGEALVEAAVTALRELPGEVGGAAWARRAEQELLPPLLDDPRGFLEWARHHPRWSGVVAEASAGVCAKPREAAVVALRAIAEELLDPDAGW